MGDGLNDVSVTGHMANSPLAHSCAAQTKDIAGKERDRFRSDLVRYDSSS